MEQAELKRLNASASDSDLDEDEDEEGKGHISIRTVPFISSP
jgi:hypothetical protein